MLPDYDGCLRLLAAHARLWLRDAGEDPDALAEIAAWLDMTPAELLGRLHWQPAPMRESAYYRVCPGCGRALPEHNAGASGAGRRRLYCDDRCRRRAAQLRKERNDDAV